MAQQKRIQLGTMMAAAQWVKDLALLWLWSRPAAVASSGTLAWESPYATSAALQSPKKKKKVHLTACKSYLLRSSHRGAVVNESD